METSEGRIAEFLVTESNQYSKLVKQGKPNVYLLNSVAKLSGEDLRWFEIGSPNQIKQQDHKVIILMGATGCGKSTLINGMTNYILGVKWDDPFRFVCTRDEVAQNQAYSQTSSVTAYTIHHKEGMAIPYSITIIDTPGYGDTSGIERDKKITQSIHRFLMAEDARIDLVHAACFVAASGESRLTVTQRYIIDSVLSIFGKDFKDNIRLLVTFSDNAVPPVVEACRAAHFPMNSPSEGITYSKFNSSVLYASNQEMSSFDELFWDMGKENFEKFFHVLEGMGGRDLRSTREVIQQRQKLEQSLKDIEIELETCFVQIENIDMFLKKMAVHGQVMKKNKNFLVQKTEMWPTQVKCENGFFAYNCDICRKTCEEPVQFVNPEDSPKRKQPCKVGVCKCATENHAYQPFIWRALPIKVETSLEIMKAEYESNYQGKLTTKELLAKCSAELNQKKMRVIDLLNQVCSSSRFLDSTALRSNSLSPSDYLSLMRSRVAEEQAPGYLTRLETLTELHQLLVSDDGTSIPQPSIDDASPLLENRSNGTEEKSSCCTILVRMICFLPRLMLRLPNVLLCCSYRHGLILPIIFSLVFSNKLVLFHGRRYFDQLIVRRRLRQIYSTCCWMYYGRQMDFLCEDIYAILFLKNNPLNVSKQLKAASVMFIRNGYLKN